MWPPTPLLPQALAASEADGNTHSLFRTALQPWSPWHRGTKCQGGPRSARPDQLVARATQLLQSVSACPGNTCSGLRSALWHQQPGHSLYISAPCSVRQSPPGVWPNRPASEHMDEGVCGHSATALHGLIFYTASLRAQVSSSAKWKGRCLFPHADGMFLPDLSPEDSAPSRRGWSQKRPWPRCWKERPDPSLVGWPHAAGACVLTCRRRWGLHRCSRPSWSWNLWGPPAGFRPQPHLQGCGAWTRPAARYRGTSGGSLWL